MKKYIDKITLNNLYEYFSTKDFDRNPSFPSHWGGVINRQSFDSISFKICSHVQEFKFQQLFYDTSYSHLADHSPFLFEFQENEKFFLEYLEEVFPLFGFLWSGEASLQISKKHWKSLLTVVLPTHKLTHFRFYSPTVFAKIAMSCTEKELAWLLGPFTHIFIPVNDAHASGKKIVTGWSRITNPRFGAESPREIAETYKVIDSPWWQITEEHTRAFSETLNKVYRDNLEQRLWEQYPEQAREIDAQYGSVGNFVAASLQDAHACGFRTHEQEYRFLLLGVHYDFSSATCPHLKPILEMTPDAPETALARLEQALRNPSHD